MTREEGDRIDRLTAVVAELTTEVRTANVANALEVEHMKVLCQERHGPTIERLEHLERSERKTLGLKNKLAGMGIPLGLLVAVGLGVLNLVL